MIWNIHISSASVHLGHQAKNVKVMLIAYIMTYIPKNTNHMLQIKTKIKQLIWNFLVIAHCWIWIRWVIEYVLYENKSEELIKFLFANFYAVFWEIQISSLLSFSVPKPSCFLNYLFIDRPDAYIKGWQNCVRTHKCMLVYSWCIKKPIINTRI